MTGIVSNAARALLASIVDYAGTFPPAGLGLTDALRSYRDARGSHDGWMLGRFVLPASRLRELERLGQSWLDDSTHEPLDVARGRPWPMSLIMSGDPAEMEEVARWTSAWKGRVDVAALEYRPQPVSIVEQLVRRQPQGAETFVEVSLDSQFDARVSEVARIGAGVKIRTGGVEAHLFPDAVSLAQALTSCVRAGVVVKASAGLHHALRADYPLTYDPHSGVATMHGFLNLSVAALLARAGGSTPEIVAALGETGRNAFSFDDRGLSWNGRTFSTEALADLRRHFFRSFTSCSFADPTTELEHMGIV